MNFRKVSVLLKISGSYKKNFFILLTLTCFNALLEGFSVGLYLPIIAWATGQQGSGFFIELVNSWIGEMSLANKVTYGVSLLAVVIVLKTTLKLYINWYAISFYTKLRSFWISSLHDGFLQSPLLNFFKTRNGEKLNLMNNEANLATQAVSDLINLVMRLTVVCAYLGVLLLTSWKVTLCAIGGLGFFAFLYVKFGKATIINLAHERHINDSQQTSFLAESLNGVKQIKIYGLYESVRNKRDQYLANYQRQTKKQDFLEKMPIPLGELLLIVFAAFGLLWLQSNAEANILTHIPKIGVFVLALKPLLTQVTDAASLKIGFDNRWKSMEVISYGLESIQEVEANGNKQVQFPLRKGIECRDLTFSYDKKKDPVIQNLSCQFPQKGLVLIKGPSGKGKTTLIDLVQGFYKDYQGNVKFDDIELRDIDLSHLRKRIGYVTQDHYFFHGTIRENLVSPGVEINDDVIRKICEDCSCWAFVDQLPGKLDSIMAEGASNLSGGQKQRLSIVRSLLKDPEVLIFDEPTNALDSTSRDLIVKTISKLSEDRMVIIVTHDEAAFSSIKYETVHI